MQDGISWWASPLLSTVLAIAVAWIAISFDRRKTANQELIRKRLAIYDEMAPKLNDLLCFFFLVGDFKNLPPPTLIAYKRALDRTAHIYLPIFSPALKERYSAFINTCFLPYGGGSGRPALIRARLETLTPEWGSDWKADWNSGFVTSNEDAAELDEVRRRYDDLLAQFARELGAGRSAKRGRSG